LYAAVVPFGDRTPRKLLLEIAGVAAVVALAAFLIWWLNRAPPINNVRPLGGRNVDITRNNRAQWAVSAALDPEDPNVLLAGSIDQLEDTRVYTSEDGGSTWQSRAQPGLLRSNCGRSDPTVAIGRSHLQLYAFLATVDCRPLDPHIRLAWRHGSAAPWHVVVVARGPHRRFVFDQRPALAAGPDGAVLAWLRFVGATNSDEQRVLVSRSSDGRAWSSPLRLPFIAPYQASVAIAPDGDVYVAVADAIAGLVALRSQDGGRTFGHARRVAPLQGVFAPVCGHGDVTVPAQPQRCIGPSPTISVDGGRVLVTFTRREADQTQAVEAAVLDRDLGLMRVGAVASPDDGLRDQFTPTSTIDRSTGDLWVCFYDTTGDETRKHAWFTCTVSDDDARTWAPPVHAASVRSNETRFSADNDGYGDVQAVVAAGGVAHPLWTDSRRLEDSEEIYTTRLRAADLLRRER
jgi:hypothetical protein